MRVIKLTFSLLVTLVVISLWSIAAQAQATRTWVSGVGDDANPCSRTAPCKTFAGAISKTAAGGEIDALDPAGYGGVTITKAITIDGGGGQVASVLVSGTNGISVQAGPLDVVTLRNLRINGIAGTGSGGTNGIRYVSGAALHVENCDIFGFTGDGINVVTSATAALFVNNTFVTNNANGIQIAPTAANVRSMLVQVRADGNSGYGFLLNTGAGLTGTVIDDSSALVNGTGIGVNGGKLFLGNSVVVRNGFGVAIMGGSVLSYKTNMIDGNTSGDGTPLTGIPLN
jgi:parallel beta helix pectate lyase-like protein